MTQGESEAEWHTKVADADPLIEAGSLYRGRAFNIAKRVAEEVDADLMILSAGLGAVMSTTRIPSYDVSLGRGGLKSFHKDFDVSSWWRVVSKGRFSTDVASELENRSFVLICLSHAYVTLIATDLEYKSAHLKCRIFGAGLEKVLSAKLMTFVVNYDDRLGAAGFPGTKSDFAQRAMRHYVSLIRPPCRDTVRDDAIRIERSLSGFPKPKQQAKNMSVDDVAIVSRMRTLRHLGLSRSKLLRYFRDVEHVACEQSRFTRLYDLALNAKG